MNHDNMEGLFREAAENYQLSSEEAVDWDRVVKGLQDPADDENENKQPEKRKRRFILWCLLLVATGWFANYAWNGNFHKDPQKSKVADNYADNKNKEAENNTIRLQQPSAAATQSQKESSRRTEKNVAVISDRNLSSNASSFHANEPALNIAPVMKANKNNIAINNSILLNNLAKTKNNSIDIFEKPVTNSVTSDSSTTSVNTDNFNKELYDKGPGNKGSSSKNPAPKSPAFGFYAGLLISPELTFVKFQKASPGYSFGLTAGYRFNKEWSIETGIQLDKKNYYTKGEYFDKSGIPYFSQSDVKLLSVDGNCNMIEVPINIRYTFNSHNGKSNLSASVGASSYFMFKEYYDYYMTVRGEPEDYSHTYHPASKNLFAALNLGISYDRKINRDLNLRIEPYFKSPLSGIGTGKLSISGTGINVGVIKKFH